MEHLIKNIEEMRIREYITEPTLNTFHSIIKLFKNSSFKKGEFIELEMHGVDIVSLESLLCIFTNIKIEKVVYIEDILKCDFMLINNELFKPYLKVIDIVDMVGFSGIDIKIKFINPFLHKFIADDENNPSYDYSYGYEDYIIHKIKSVDNALIVYVYDYSIFKSKYKKSKI